MPWWGKVASNTIRVYTLLRRSGQFLNDWGKSSATLILIRIHHTPIIFVNRNKAQLIRATRISVYNSSEIVKYWFNSNGTAMSLDAFTPNEPDYYANESFCIQVTSSIVGDKKCQLISPKILCELNVTANGQFFNEIFCLIKKYKKLAIVNGNDWSEQIRFLVSRQRVELFTFKTAFSIMRNKSVTDILF